MPTPSPILGQVTPNGAQPPSNQNNFGQVCGEVLSAVPHCPYPQLQSYVNNAARAYYDRRYWYGLMVKGQIQCPGYYQAGTVQLTQGSTTVLGTGTSWTAQLGGLPLIGQQLRVGFTAPIYTIINANLSVSPQTLTLELPWGLPSVASTGYFITQYYFTIPNLRFFVSVKNLQMMFRLWTNVPQSLIENWDPARLQMFYPRVVATMPPDPSGNYQFEMWPVPSTPQSFPYLGYVLPPNLVNDSDNFPAYMRCDIIKAKALADALLYRPKANPNYSESMCLQVSQQKLKEYEVEVERATQMDEGLYRQDIITWQEQMPMASIDMGTGNLTGGAMMAAMLPVMAEDYY